MSEMDLWNDLRTVCLGFREQIDDQDRNQDKHDKFQFEFIKQSLGNKRMEARSRIDDCLVENTRFINNKIEAIFRVAQEESSDSVAEEMTQEYLEPLIDLIKDLFWLIRGISEDRCSRHLYKQYTKAAESVLEIILGLERIWISIRSGHSGIPRIRDWSTEHFFKNLPTDSQEDAKNQWTEWIEEMKDINDQVKRIRPFNAHMRSNRIIEITFNIMKKVRLTYLTQDLSPGACDQLLEMGEEVTRVVRRITSLTRSSDTYQCNQIISDLNESMNQLVLWMELDETAWFKDNLRTFNEICNEISLSNPCR